MKRILIFAGTTEGRQLAERLDKAGVYCDVSIATEYGHQFLRTTSYLRVLVGRLSIEQMKKLYEEEVYAAVVDATHPFATVVTENIKKSLEGTGIRYFRLGRDVSLEQDAILVDSVEECIDCLLKMEGRILLTTGSKELQKFCQQESIRKRVVARVLPGLESLQLCYESGLEGKQIIAMQGPFTREMNRCQIEDYGIDILVTKESGTVGGVDTKLWACHQRHIPCIMIRKPGYEKVTEESMDEICDHLEEITGRKIKNGPTTLVHLVGIGPGSRNLLTGEARKVIEQAEVLFGAKRMLDTVDSPAKKYPYYLAEDILPILRNRTDLKSAVVLFSGDTGFYSGCEKLYGKLKQEENLEPVIHPGVSSLSYFASRLGRNYSNAGLLSTHGVLEKEWKNQLLEAVRRTKLVLLLTSGREDVKAIHEYLFNLPGWKGKVMAGRDLSYDEEEIFEVTSESDLKDGLYVAAVITENMEQKPCTPFHSDEEFLRDEVPMTKEEVRHLSVCKLGLTPGAIVYDIGSGTGSVAIEIADLDSAICVYAIESNPKACELIARNREEFGCNNLEIVEGMAPAAMENLKCPSHAFIGGSKGNLREILLALKERNPDMRVVMNAVSLESICQMKNLMEELELQNVDITEVSVTKSRNLGKYHMLTGNNPVFIYSFTFV